MDFPKVFGAVCAIAAILPIRNLSRQAFRARLAVVSLRLAPRRCENRGMKTPIRRSASTNSASRSASTCRAGSRRRFRRTRRLPAVIAGSNRCDAARHARDIFEAQAEDTRRRALDVFVPRAVHGIRRVREVGDRRADFARSAVLRHRRCGERPRRGQLHLHAHRAETRRHRDRQHLFLAAARAHARGHRGHVPADGECLRRWDTGATSGNATAAICRRAPRPRASASPTKGMFRQAIVNKGRNRDTTWFAIIDGDWNGGLQGRLSTLARPGQFRRRRRAEAEAVGAHGAVRARATGSATRREETPRSLPASSGASSLSGRSITLRRHSFARAAASRIVRAQHEVV